MAMHLPKGSRPNDEARRPGFGPGRSIPILLLIPLAIAALSGPATSPASSPARHAPLQDADTTGGLRFTLVEIGSPSSEGPAEPEIEPLSDSGVARVLARVPSLSEVIPVRSTVLRDAVRPPPRTGVTVRAPFPPERPAARDAPETPDTGPLEVVRHGPVGDVERSAQVSVTFSQAMVSVGTRADVEAREVPARITPDAMGRWRWVGTRTLVFEPDPPLAPATEYTVEVPAGVASVRGSRRADADRWSFRTGRPEIVGAVPGRGRPVARDPVIVLAFDQAVDRDSVLAHARLAAEGRSQPLRLATDSGWIEDPWASWARHQPSERVVPLRPAEPLPGDSEIRVTVLPGTPSAEGPLRTDTAQVVAFRTYGPLRVAYRWCAIPIPAICRPGRPLGIRFTNPLDVEAFGDSLVRVEPEVPGLRIEVSGWGISLSGETRPRTTVRVTLDRRIRDTFGQTLGEPVEVEFDIDRALPMLAGRGRPWLVLDPRGPPEVRVQTINVDSLTVQAYEVEPKDWPVFARGIERLRWRDTTLQPPGTLKIARTIPVGASPDVQVETAIDLGPALRDRLGHIVLAIEPVGRFGFRERPRNLYVWVQGTRLGLGAFADGRATVAWVTSLLTGRAATGAEVTLLPDDRSARTDARGLAEIAFAASFDSTAHVVVARRGPDVALLPLERPTPGPAQGSLRWHAFTDRPLYRPGERVHVKGWLRHVGPEADDGLELPDSRVARVSWSVVDPAGREGPSGQTGLVGLGAFDFAFQLPEELDLGEVHLTLAADGLGDEMGGREHTQPVAVEEFRRPEFTAALEHGSGPHAVGSRMTAGVTARYLSGGAPSDADVEWYAASSPARFTPPNRDGFTFGAVPEWEASPDVVEELYATTDDEGRSEVRLDFLAADPPVTSKLDIHATVSDVNRQSWTASSSVLVHPASVYVGLRSERRFVRAGEPLTVEALVVDLDGAVVPDRPIELRAVRIQWAHVDGAWRRGESDARECDRTSAASSVRCQFETPEAGLYRIEATTRDEADRPSTSELFVYAGGHGSVWLTGVDGGSDTTGALPLVADREAYAPGDTAEILVQSPFAAAEGVFRVSGSGILRVDRFELDGPSRVLRIPILETHIPNVHVGVDLVPARAPSGAATEPGEYEGVSGSIDLAVSAESRRLGVRVSPRDWHVAPRGETVVDVEVTDAEGRSLPRAEVTLVVVDEAVLALSTEAAADPILDLHPHRGPGTRDAHLRSRILTGDPGIDAVAGTVFDARTGLPVAGALVEIEGAGRHDTTDAAGGFRLAGVPPGAYTVTVKLIGYASAQRRVSVPRGGAVVVDFALEEAAVRLNESLMLRSSAFVSYYGPSSPSPSIALREDFDPLAAFVATAHTGSDGRVAIPVSVPDNLTRYRVIAVAAAGARTFGRGESTITAGLPLTVRPSPPRFLNHGDRFELPVVVRNTTDSAMTAELAVRGRNLEWTGRRGARVTLPPRGRVEVRFPAATALPGEARFQVAGVAAQATDAAEIAFPVRAPTTVEAFAAYGEVDSGAVAVPIQPPEDVLEGFGGLEVTTSSTALHALGDALLYLTSYPYECTEQTASRLLGLVTMRDVVAAFDVPGTPDPAALTGSVERDVARLAELQNPDGGFSFWGPIRLSSPYVTVHALHALARARGAGYAVPDETLEKGLGYLRTIDRRVVGPVWVRRLMVAYSLYVRNLLGDPDVHRALRLVRERRVEDTSLEVLARALPVLTTDPSARDEVDAIRREFGNRAVEETGTAHFVTGFADGAHLVLHSDRRTDAVVLEALIDDTPEHELIPKLVRGLLAHRTNGRWRTTQENVFALLALHRYFEAFERDPPDLVLDAWLDDQFAGRHAFRGRNLERFRLDVPMERLVERRSTRDLVLSREGTGRLYYRVGLRYAPADFELPAAEQGLVVERAYQAVDDSADVRREGGTWIVRAGARVRVRLTLVAPGRRHQVALVDPLPAGLEPVNADLAGAAVLSPAERAAGGWRRWHDHANQRDDRTEVFASMLPGGVYTYTYLARATTPGTFIVPPARAEEMYSPETFGRGPTARLVVR